MTKEKNAEKKTEKNVSNNFFDDVFKIKALCCKSELLFLTKNLEKSISIKKKIGHFKIVHFRIFQNTFFDEKITLFLFETEIHIIYHICIKL